MKIRFLLLGTSLSLIPQTINAQCVATQDCATLGYTETSCSGGSGVKCPFGNKWACFKSESEIKDQLCSELSFTLSCTGTNQTGGASQACNGKYSECTCASGYEWKDDSCQKQVLNGAHGNLYYCNGKVVGVKTSGMDFYIAMKDLDNMSCNNAINACSSYVFCNTVKGVLTSFSHLKIMYDNKSSLNSLLSTNGGTKLTERDYWSSSTGMNDTCLTVDMSNGNYDFLSNSNKLSVRPILYSY